MPWNLNGDRKLKTVLTQASADWTRETGDNLQARFPEKLFKRLRCTVITHGQTI